MRLVSTSEVRVLLLTGNALRHRHAATALADACNLVGVLYESKRAAVRSEGFDEADSRVIETHLCGLREEEKRFFAGAEWPDTVLRGVPYGVVNGQEAFEWVEHLAPDVIVLFGTCIIRPPLLDAYGDSLVNVHLGLSPYYRGTATNFWPLVHREPECVGATIHMAVSRVDAGGILAQLRPEAERHDTAHSLGMKTIREVWSAVPQVLAGYLAQSITPHAQDLSSGRVFRRDDFDARAVRQMWRHFETDMMDEYVRDIAVRQAHHPIVSPAET